MKKELKIGLVGTGMIGRSHIERINAQMQGARVVAVSDSAEELGKSVAKQNQCLFFECGEEMIASDEVDAVIVTTIDAYHEKFVIASINAGKYCFVEKPLAIDLAGAKRIVEAEIKGGKKLVQVGFMRRYDKGVYAAKKYLEERTYGEPLMLHCAHRNPSVSDDYTTPMAVENSMIHEIDVIRWLLGENFTTAEVVFPKQTKHTHEKLVDPQIMYLTTESGIRIDVEAFVNARYGYDIKCEICCEEGIMNLPDPGNVAVRAKASNTVPLCESWLERFPDAYNTEIQLWINATAEDRIDGPSSWDGYVAQLTAAAASKARDAQRPVAVEIEESPAFYN